MRAAGSLIMGPLTLLLGRYLGVGTPYSHSLPLPLTLTPTHSHSPRSPLSLSLALSLLHSLACTFSHPSHLSDSAPTTKVTLAG
ncbi:uncharacterized protein LY79DRAFT_287465 [Colletotrichum navitas]|uniref:Secreted protein n=1 Tax=Colletotrichum navitas TaxID=681940 RepID=A0AAD8Q9I2_9PEZI|nr:uncharacterized protein LY79DRAFT_287465 [Colletotrichum navitas]KAK1598387.1 hypothetical protein LY79DRAFT_287465 [Colletotrichum navitas]